MLCLGDHLRWQRSGHNCCAVWQQVNQGPGSNKQRKKQQKIIVISNNFIIQVLNSDPNLEVIETREFTPDGQVMRLIHTMPRKPNIKSVRVYKRIN